MAEDKDRIAIIAAIANEIIEKKWYSCGYQQAYSVQLQAMRDILKVCTKKA